MDIHMFKADDVNVLFHAPSSQFFEVTRDLYNRMEQYFDGSAALDTKAQEVMDYLAGLPVLGKSEPRTGQRLVRLAFLSTQSCNLRCRYCFANHGYYTETEYMRMPIEVYKDTMRYMLDKYPAGIKLIQFFGGEPLLGFNEIKQFVPYCLELFKSKNLALPSFGVVTNGTVFTDEMAEFFNEYDIPVTISLDGTKEINDMARISPTGWSVYDKIKENLDWLNLKRTFPLLVEITLNKQHVLAYKPGIAAQWLNEIYDLGFDGGVIGVAESTDGLLELTEEYEEDYKRMYREMGDYWFDNLYGDRSFCNFDIMRMIKTLTMKEARGLPCGAGLDNLTVTAKGDILPCYLLYGHDEFLMGNVAEDDQSFDKVRDVFAEGERYKPKECRQCWVRHLCTIWCRGFGYTMRQDISTISPPRCWTAEALIEGVMLNLARIKRDPERYKNFKERVMAFNDKYKGAEA